MEELHISLKAKELISVAGLPITNALASAVLVTVVLVIFALLFRRKIAMIPGKIQAFLEVLFVGILDYMEETLESRRLAKRFFPLITTLFLFILLANYTEIIPGVGSILFQHAGESTKLFRPASTDLNFTIALSIVSMVVIQVVGVLTIGILKYGGKFVNLKSVLGFFIGLIELVSELARLVSFSFRLFGNIFAGKVLILVATAFIPFFLPVPLLIFEVFVGLIQAAIFALLTLFFIKLAMEDPHGEEDEEKEKKQAVQETGTA